MSLLGSDVHLSGGTNDGFSPGSWLCRLCSRQPIIRHRLILRRCEQDNLGCFLHVRHSTARKSSTIVTVSTPKSAGIMPSSGRHRQGRYCVRGGALSYHADTRKNLGNESSQRASGRVRSFRKDRGQLGVASRDPPLLSALPHRHPSATSCWLAACSRPTTRKRELAARRLKFPCPAQNDRICDGVTRSRSSRGRDGLYKVAMSCSVLRSTVKAELHSCEQLYLSSP